MKPALMSIAADATPGGLPNYVAQRDEVALFEQAWRNRLPVMLKGPTGCGKTRFVEHMAARLGLPLHTVACHDDLGASDLVGRHLLDASGTFWSDGPLTRAVREGGICYLDEIVEARRDTTVIIHPLADDRRVLPIERTGELLHAPASFMLVISFNPAYQSITKRLKPSTRQRFVAMNFDTPSPALEARIVQAESACAPEIAEQLVALGTAMRRLRDIDLEESVSTRLLVYAARLIHAGMAPARACEASMVDAMTDEPDTRAALAQLVDAAFGG